jgi:hypothetical protein
MTSSLKFAARHSLAPAITWPTDRTAVFVDPFSFSTVGSCGEFCATLFEPAGLPMKLGTAAPVALHVGDAKRELPPPASGVSLHNSHNLAARCEQAPPP